MEGYDNDILLLLLDDDLFWPEEKDECGDTINRTPSGLMSEIAPSAQSAR